MSWSADSLRANLRALDVGHARFKCALYDASGSPYDRTWMAYTMTHTMTVPGAIYEAYEGRVESVDGPVDGDTRRTFAFHVVKHGGGDRAYYLPFPSLGVHDSFDAMLGFAAARLRDGQFSLPP